MQPKTKKPKKGLAGAVSAPVLSATEKEKLVQHVLHDPILFQLAIEEFDLTDFADQLDDELALVLAAAREAAKEHHIGPGDASFRSRVRTQLEHILADPGTKEDYFGADPETLLDAVYEIDPAELHPLNGIDLLQRMLIEHRVIKPWRDAIGRVSGDYIPLDIGAVLADLQGRLDRIKRLGAVEVPNFQDDWQSHKRRLKKLRERELLGLKTGLNELDRHTRGLRGLMLLGAMPGVGKTTWVAGEIALGVLRHHKVNDAVVVILSLDMDRFDLYTRIHCNLADLDWLVLTQGSPPETRAAKSKFSKAHEKKLDTAVERMKAYEIPKRLYVADRCVVGDQLSAQRIRMIVETCKARAKATRALLIIDYLQLLPVPEEIADRGELHADKYRVRLVQEVLEAGRNSDDPVGDVVFAICEARKPPTAKDAWGQSLSELMGSARLPYAADAVFLYRSMRAHEILHYYDLPPNSAAAEGHLRDLLAEGVSPVIVRLEKGRDGMLRGEWGMEFHFYKSQFRELEATAPSAHGKSNGSPSSSSPQIEKLLQGIDLEMAAIGKPSDEDNAEYGESSDDDQE